MFVSGTGLLPGPCPRPALAVARPPWLGVVPPSPPFLLPSPTAGRPELKLGLNDKLMFEATGRTQGKGKAVELEDIKFHQCVRLARFENDRTISFIPPDGEFELMSYRSVSFKITMIYSKASALELSSRSKVFCGCRNLDCQYRYAPYLKK